MTLQQVAEYLLCHPSGLLKKKQIPAFKLGKDWRFSRSVIDEWIARLHNTTNPPVTRDRKSKVS